MNELEGSHDGVRELRHAGGDRPGLSAAVTGDAPTPDFNAPRLFVEADLAAGAEIPCTAEQTNYLVNVLRLKPGEAILTFNGRDGEWQATLGAASKKSVSLRIQHRIRAQERGPDIDYLFAPLKRARLDYMVQKAVEMGVARLRPVVTRRTIAERVNLDRMRANAIEAAEQCGILHLPDILRPEPLERVLATWDPARPLIFCDERAALSDPVAALRTVAGSRPMVCSAVLIGPEGGFAPEERERLLALPFATAISLGPRILRADTAAVAALALVNAVFGDGRG